jgi:hypothetical protein
MTTTIVCCCCRCLPHPWPTWSPRSCWSRPSLTLLFPALLCLQAIASYPPFLLLSAFTTGPSQALLVGRCWPLLLSRRWLVVTSMPNLRFVVRRPLSSLQVLMLLSTADALFCPSPSTALLLSSPAAVCLCCSSVNGLLFRLCPLRRPPSVLSSAARFHHLTPSCKRRRFRCWPPPPFATHHQPQMLAFAALPSMVGCCVLRPPSSSTHFCHCLPVQSSTLVWPTQNKKYHQTTPFHCTKPLRISYIRPDCTRYG